MEDSFTEKLYLPQREDAFGGHEKILYEIADFISRVVVEKDITHIARDATETIARLFHLSEIIVCLWDEEINRFKILAAQGYRPDVTKEILNLEYVIDWLIYGIPDKYLVEEDILFLSTEMILEARRSGDMDQLMKELLDEESDALMIDRPEDIHKPRPSEDHWHELDFFEFIIRNREGKPIGYIEINDSEDDKLPSRYTLLLTSIFISIVGIAFESARLRRKQERVMNRVDDLTSLMTNDLDRSLKESSRILNILKRTDTNEIVWKQSVEELIRSTKDSLALIEKVHWLKEIESRPYDLMVGTDPIIYLNKSIDQIRREYPEIGVDTSNDKKPNYIRGDPAMTDLFNTCFKVIIPLKKSMEEKLKIDLNRTAVLRGLDELDISITSADIDTTAWRRLMIELSSIDPKHGKFHMTSDIFNKYLMIFIARRYGGKIFIEEKLSSGKGAYRGALHIRLPIHD